MEMLVLGFVVGGMLVAVLISLTTISKINEYEEENQTLYLENAELRFENEELRDTSINAEQRALIHFRKLYAIENIIKNDEEKHEFITETMKKIKEVITSDQTNK